ncbi:MAG: FG-GAP repeat protein [Polyangiaceae bacterium]|nr:FG-GAP repeat protein [Polyangiaceae bacterium]
MRSPTHRVLLFSVAFAGSTCNSSPPTKIDVPTIAAFAPNAPSLVTTAETKIVAPNGKPSDLFGFSVAMSGDTIIIGTPYEDSAAQDAGAAYVFVRKNGDWLFEQKLVAPDFGATRWFGYSVAIDGDNAIVGSPQADGNMLDAGAAYVFSRTNGSWSALPKIVASDGKPSDMFGHAVAISGNSLLVGCPKSDAKGIDAGAAYVFVWNGAQYAEQKKLLTADAAPNDHLGAAVAMDGETALVGAPDAGVFGPNSGSAYVFFRQGTLWSQQKKLISPNGAAGDAFGWAVDIEHNSAIVGAPHADSMGADSGAAYSFVRTGIAWNPNAILLPQGLAADDRFGSSVAMSGNSTVIGALLDDTTNANTGAAYVFTRNGSSWSQDIELVASDAVIGDAYGFAVAISGDTTVVSAYLDDDLGTSSGSAYVYVLKNDTGDDCVSAAECASGYCVDGVCCDSACDLGPCDGCSIATGASADGICTLLDGATCDDGNACTLTDTCLVGQCVGASPMVCSDDPCFAGICDPATGVCLAEVKPDGANCDDGNACTALDVCTGGVCLGTKSTECLAINACHAEGTCDTISGACSALELPDGTVCPGGACRSGTCVPNELPPTGVLVTGGGCDCRMHVDASAYTRGWGSAAMIGLVAMRKARQRRSLHHMKPR